MRVTLNLHLKTCAKIHKRAHTHNLKSKPLGANVKAPMPTPSPPLSIEDGGTTATPREVLLVPPERRYWCFPSLTTSP